MSFKNRHKLLMSLILCCLCSLIAMSASAAELEEVIAANVEARGGMDALKAASSARMTGTMALGPGMDAPFVITFKRPDMMRLEFEFQGQTGIQSFDGTTGWGLMPFMGQTEATALSGDELSALKDQADFDGPLVDHKDKGHTVELMGTMDVDGTEAHKVKITKANGDVLFTFIDTDSSLEFKQEGRRKIQGSEINMVVEMGDYKKVGDLVLAHSMTQTAEGAPAGQTITIQQIELDVDVEDSFFAMPEKDEPADEESAKKAGE